MPELVVGVLLLVAVVVAGMAGQKLGEWWAGVARSRLVEAAAPRHEVDMKRLLEIAAVSDDEIVAAAEWRAEHPDEPEPEILANLDPAAWAIEPPQVGGVRKPQVPVRPSPPPPKPSAGGPTPAELSPGCIVVAPSTEHFGSELLKAINRNRTAVVIPAGMELRPIPVQRPNPYARCKHEDAEREQIMALDSAEPVKVIVTACSTCDRLAELKSQLAAHSERIKAMAAGFTVDDDGRMSVTEAQYDAYCKAVGEAEELKQLIVGMGTGDQSATWPGRMF